MATTTRPDQDQDLHKGDFDQWERELHHPDPTADTADQAAADAEERSIQRAKQILQDDAGPVDRNSESGKELRRSEVEAQRARRLMRDQESNPQTPGASDKSAADQESKPQIPFTPGGGKQGFFKKMAKRRAQIMAGFAIIGVLIGGAVAIYQSVTDLPRNLATQASRVVKARVNAYYRERIKPYLLQYLIGQVLLNRIGIDSCKDDFSPAPIVTKDCFYRHKKQYPSTFVGKAFQAWKDGRMEARLAAQGVTINYSPNAILDPQTGRRGELWVIKTPAGEVPVDPANPETQMRQLFETREFEDPTRGGRAAILEHIMSAVERSNHTNELDTMSQRKHLWRKYAIRGCNFYCRHFRINKTEATPQSFRNYLLGLVVKAVAPGVSAKLAIGCMLAPQYECQESDPEFRKAYAAQIDELKTKEGGQERLTELLNKANAAKNRTEKSLAGYFTKLILVKLANKLAPTLASYVTSGIPILGQIFAALGTALAIVNVAILYYTVSEVLAGPVGQFLRTMVRAENFSALWAILRQVGDERFAAKQVYDLNADGAYNQLLKGYEQSHLWQSQYGNKENFKDYTFLFPQEAHAATLEDYPYKCSDDPGDVKPTGELICPKWKFDYKPPIAQALASVRTTGDVNQFLGDVTAVGNDISQTIGAPFEAIAEPILETEAAKAAMAAIEKETKPLTDIISNEVLAPPFDNFEDVKGAKFVDGAWIGADWLTNDEIRGGLAADGSPEGWARVLSESEVKVQESQIVRSIQNEFASLSLWDRIFSTQYNQSFMSQIAYAAPNGINTPIDLASSLFNPSMGLRFAAITQNVQAAPADPHPANIPQYGVGGELYTTPIRTMDDTTPCPNDRTPIDLNTPGAIDRGLGRAEFPTTNMCRFDEKTLFRYAGYLSGEPVDPETAATASRSNFGNGAPGVVTGTFRWPIDEDDFGGVTSCYGWRKLNGNDDFHGGLDMVGKKGENQTLIRAVDGGTVIAVNPYSPSAGGFVTIKHREGVYSFYMHMVPSSIVVKPGQPIGKGDVIGKEGNTGRSFGAHLHFAVGPSPTISDASSVNPLNNRLGSLTRTGVYANGDDCP